MSHATTRRPLAIAVLVLLAGCGSRNDTPAADTVSRSGEAASPAPAPAAPIGHPVPSDEAVANVDLTGIAKASGGKTVAEVFAEKDQLAGQRISIRGKVVKASGQIMDRHWLHIRDGSGAAGTNDITVTVTSDPPKAGDIVVVTGQVAVNKDFGIGYQYDVIIEDAEVTVEATGP